MSSESGRGGNWETERNVLCCGRQCASGLCYCTGGCVLIAGSDVFPNKHLCGKYFQRCLSQDYLSSYHDESFITIMHSKLGHLRCMTRHVRLSTLDILRLIRCSVVEQGAVAPHQRHGQLLEEPLHLHSLILTDVARFGRTKFLHLGDGALVPSAKRFDRHG